MSRATGPWGPRTRGGPRLFPVRAQRSGLVSAAALSLLVWLSGLAIPAFAQEATHKVGVWSTRLTDPARSDREVGAKVFYPEGFSGRASVILVSHGGRGSDRGENALDHLGDTFARKGFVAVQIGHRPSASGPQHNIDRPKDVSFVLDALAKGALSPPKGFAGTLNLERVGHAGHSWGSYTSLAVGGADYGGVSLRDPRIAAIAPISPVGVGQYGAFDRGGEDNTWSRISLPVFMLIGGAEMNESQSPAIPPRPGFRREGFDRMHPPGDKFLAIVPDQIHAQMAGQGSPGVKAYVAENIAAFFDVYLRGAAGRRCEVGALAAPLPGGSLERKLDPAQPGPAACPPLVAN
jgi:hypothetical protein